MNNYVKNVIFLLSLLASNANMYCDSTAGGASCDPQKRTQQSEAISEEIVALLKITGVQCELTLPAIVKATQKAWLRPSGKERWEIEEICDEEMGDKIFNLCASLGYIQELKPRHTKYDYCCIHGGIMPRMKNRLEFAAELERRGIEVGMYVLLTGDRSLGAADEIPEFPHLPQDEAEGMMLLYNSLESLASLRGKPFVLVKAPQVQNSSGAFVRPSTHHTIRAWLATHNPGPGSCLFISGQPFCLCQAKVAEVEMPCSFAVETVGAAADDACKKQPLLLLDTVARTLYQELQNYKVDSNSQCNAAVKK